MTIQLYFDEDSSDNDLLRALRLREIDVVAAWDVGLGERADEEQHRWATEHRRMLYSSNRRDFYRIHSEFMCAGETHAGIILGIQQRYSVGEQMRRLVRLINRLSTEEMRNRVELLSAWGTACHGPPPLVLLLSDV